MSTRLRADCVDEARPSPVFVDDSGRRRRRLRVAGRVMLAGAGLYVALVILGLTGSLSLPVVHVGDVPRLPTNGGGSLGALSRVTPGVPAPAGASAGTAGVAAGANAPVELPQPGTHGVLPGATPTPGGGATSSPSTIASPQGPPTTVAVVVTTVPSTPTTRAHGVGPPTSHPGKSSRP